MVLLTQFKPQMFKRVMGVIVQTRGFLTDMEGLKVW